MEKIVMMDDDFIANKDLERKHHSKFIHKLKQIFEIEKRVREDNLQRIIKTSGHSVTCICGNCKFPVWFTYDEIIEILDDIYIKNKDREL